MVRFFPPWSMGICVWFYQHIWWFTLTVSRRGVFLFFLRDCCEVVMGFQTLFDCLGNWCRRALRCLHQFFWVCVWPSGEGRFHLFHHRFYLGFVWDAERFEFNCFGCPHVLDTVAFFKDEPHWWDLCLSEKLECVLLKVNAFFFRIDQTGFFFT